MPIQSLSFLIFVENKNFPLVQMSTVPKRRNNLDKCSWGVSLEGDIYIIFLIRIWSIGSLSEFCTLQNKVWFVLYAQYTYGITLSIGKLIQNDKQCYLFDSGFFYMTAQLITMTLHFSFLSENHTNEFDHHLKGFLHLSFGVLCMKTFL